MGVRPRASGVPAMAPKAVVAESASVKRRLSGDGDVNPPTKRPALAMKRLFAMSTCTDIGPYKNKNYRIKSHRFKKVFECLPDHTKQGYMEAMSSKRRGIVNAIMDRADASSPWSLDFETTIFKDHAATCNHISIHMLKRKLYANTMCGIQTQCVA